MSSTSGECQGFESRTGASSPRTVVGRVGEPTSMTDRAVSTLGKTLGLSQWAGRDGNDPDLLAPRHLPQATPRENDTLADSPGHYSPAHGTRVFRPLLIMPISEPALRRAAADGTGITRRWAQWTWHHTTSAASLKIARTACRAFKPSWITRSFQTIVVDRLLRIVHRHFVSNQPAFVCAKRRDQAAQSARLSDSASPAIQPIDATRTRRPREA